MPLRIPERRPTGDSTQLNKLNGGFLSFVAGALLDVIEGISSGVSFLDELGNLIGGHQQQIKDLQDKTQGLVGIVGYGCATSTGASGTAGSGKNLLPFNIQIGPIVGVTMESNGFRLGSKGLWRVDAMQVFDFYTLGANQIDLDIRVYAPDNTLFAQRFNHGENAGTETLTSIFSFVIPAAGYRVQLFGQAALGRGILAGNSYSSLNVTKISDETS